MGSESASCFGPPTKSYLRGCSHLPRNLDIDIDVFDRSCFGDTMPAVLFQSLSQTTNTTEGHGSGLLRL